MKSNLHKLYYVLAIIDIVTIVLTLFLAFGIYQTYGKSYLMNRQWVQRSMEYDHLTDLAIQANSPGNEVFKSRDVLKESQRFEKISKEIHTVEASLRKDANENLTGYPEIASKLGHFSDLITQADKVTLSIFKNIKKNQISEAAIDMAEMDAKFHEALLEASKLRTLVREAQSKQLIYYHGKAERLFLKEIYIAAFVIILIGIMLFFGRNIKKNFDQLILSLEDKNSKLSDSEKKLIAVLDNVLEAIVVIDQKGIIEYTNPQASTIFQYAPKEMLGKNVNMLMPEPYHKNHDKYIDNYLKTCDAKVIGIGREVTGLKKDGEVFPVELAVNEIKLKNNKTKFVGVLRDITEKKKSDFYLTSVTNIQKLYIGGADQKKLFNAILKFLLEYTKSEYGFIGAILYDKASPPYLKTFAITNIAWDSATKAFYKEHAPQGLEFRNLNTLFGHTIKTGEIVISDNPATDPRSGGLPKGHPEMRNYLGMPVYGGEGLIAMYGLANKPGGYDQSVVHELGAITAVMSSIIEASRGASVVEKMANMDALTGAYNRFYLKSRLADILEVKRKGQAGHPEKNQFCIMMIDLNKFKHINDYYGHEYGDYILKEFTSRLKNRIQQHDLLARIGGDEFVVVLDDVNSLSSAGRVSQRIVAVSREPYFLNDKEIVCSASVGIACYPISGDDIDALLRHAGLALYQAKASQDGYSYFSEKLQQEYTARRNLERDIVRAFENKEFYLVYQPIVEFSNYKIIGCEVLIRWMHPEHGEYLPKNYIEVIEAMGLAGELNLYVVSECLNVFKQIDAFSEKFSISINISPHAYNLEKNLEAVIGLFKQTELSPNLSFNLEITEKSFMEDNFDVSKSSNIHKLLAKQNIGLSLDDFGVEYSSITRLLDSDFAIVKIDMSFVQKLDSKSGDIAHAAKVTIESIMHLVKGLGIRVVAEGVETEVQSAILSGLGCDFGQGYYFSRPIKLESLLPLIGSKLQ